MKKETLIEVLRRERDSIKASANYVKDVEFRERLLGQAQGINSVICMLTSEDYLKLVAKQNRVQIEEDE